MTFRFEWLWYLFVAWTLVGVLRDWYALPTTRPALLVAVGHAVIAVLAILALALR